MSHNWSEADEKSLKNTVTWVEENIPKPALKDRGGKWSVVSGLLFTDIGLKVSPSACRSRFADIKSRLKTHTDNGKEVVTYLDVDFPQAGEDTEIERLTNKVSILERKVNNLINSLNEFSSIKDEISSIAAKIQELPNKNHYHMISSFSKRTSESQ